MKRLFVLGAADPEMQAIESLLIACGETVAYAMCEGKRVHPGNAYRADDVSDGFAWGAVTHLVECGALPQYSVRQTVGKCDHHRPGDAGYGLPPHRFWDGSSLGQVYWILSLHSVSIPPEMRGKYQDHQMVAAADHCLESAYRGLCPGVDPDALMAWRIKSRAEFQKRPEAEVMADVESARSILRAHVDVRCPECYCLPGGAYGTMPCDNCGGYGIHTRSAEYADLRGQTIPELPEAAAREGIPFLLSVTDRDGRKKTVLMAAPPGLVERFLSGSMIGGLVDMYGDPERGFAGGYTTPVSA